MRKIEKSKIVFILFIGFGFAIIAAIYLFFGPFSLISSAKDTIFYLSERNDTTQVTATVTDIEETSGVDSSIDYDVYVSYVYNNHSYKNIYWRTVGSKNEYSLGEVVDVNIFCSKPNDIVDPGFANYIGWIFPLIVTLCPLLVLIAYPPKFTLIKKSKT